MRGSWGIRGRTNNLLIRKRILLHLSWGVLPNEGASYDIETHPGKKKKSGTVHIHSPILGEEGSAPSAKKKRESKVGTELDLNRKMKRKQDVSVKQGEKTKKPALTPKIPWGDKVGAERHDTHYRESSRPQGGKKMKSGFHVQLCALDVYQGQ